jgi:hypothetical protein
MILRVVALLSRPSYDWMRNMSVRHPSNRRADKKVNLVFNNLKPDELADQLTFLEFKAFRRITVRKAKFMIVRSVVKVSCLP